MGSASRAKTVKTTVYIERETLQALKRLARAQGRYEAELIREAVSAYTRSQPRPRFKSLGIARGPKNLAARTDALLAEGFGSSGDHR